MKITILGNGIFGSTLGNLFKKKGHDVYFDTISDSEIIVVCTTSNIVLSSLLKFKKEIKDQKIIICSKGFAVEGKLISVLLKENFENQIFFLYGPNLANELENDVFSGMVLAGGDGKEQIKKEIESKNLYVELSDDIVGVEISATFKNVMAIFIGIIEGMNLGQNTNAFVFAKAVEEIKNIGVKLGAKTETFLGLSCVGDLFLSSRNRILGIELGKGKKLDNIIKEMNYIPGGVFDIKDAKKMVEKLNIDTPIIKCLYKVVYEELPLENILREIKK